MRLCIEATRRTVFELSRLYTQVQPYVAYFHWFRSDMTLFLTLARVVVPAAAGTLMALAGFVLSILSAIAHAIVSAFLGLPPEEPRPRVEPKLLAPTSHTRNPSTASLYSVVLSQDSDSIAQTTSETVSSKPRSNRLAEQEQEVPADDPSSSATPASQSSSQATASSSNILQISRDAFSRGQSPIRRIASQIQEDCKKRRPTRKSTSPPTISVSLPPPLTPIPSADPSTPSLSEQQSTVSNDSGRESPKPKVARSVTSPTSMPSHKKWLPRRQNSTPPQRPAPLQRTDPYQAPYFFPSPLSPDAADYVRQVRISRSSAAVGGTTFEQRKVCEPGPFAKGGVSHARGRETSIDERLGGLVPSPNVAVQVAGEREEQRSEPGGEGRRRQVPSRRLSWHPVTVTEEPAAMAPEERPSTSRSTGSGSVPNSPNSFLRKSRSLLRAPEPLAPSSSTGRNESSTKGRSRSGPSPSPDTREGSSPRPRKRFSLLEKIHHRRSHSGGKVS